MKKYKTFFISISITMLVFSAILLVYNCFFSIKDSYSLSSYITITNKKGVIEDCTINLKDCTNLDGDFELEIEIGSYEKRVIGFEISVLANYEQQYFKIKNYEGNILSKTVFVEENTKKLTIILDKNVFQSYQNQFILNIRQDIEELSYENELVRDSNTLNFRYNVKNDEGEINEKIIEETHKNIIEYPIDDIDSGIVFEINNFDDNPLIRINGGEEVLLNLNVGGSKLTEDYIILAYVNSKQVKINKKKNCYLKIQRNMLAHTNLNIEIEENTGIYELELYCVPAPYDEVNENMEGIISAKRYTIKVEL